MKIFVNNAVYVQKNDIAFLSALDLPILGSVFMKVFGNGITIIDDNNRYDFVKFDEEEEIAFFKNLDFIVDYNDVKYLSDEKIIDLGNDIAMKKNSLARTFNVMSDSVRAKNMHIVTECKKYDFKMYSLRDILWFRQGHLKFALPSEVVDMDNSKKKSVKGFRKILKKFKKK